MTGDEEMQQAMANIKDMSMEDLVKTLLKEGLGPCPKGLFSYTLHVNFAKRGAQIRSGKYAKGCQIIFLSFIMLLRNATSTLLSLTFILNIFSVFWCKISLKMPIFGLFWPCFRPKN